MKTFIYKILLFSTIVLLIFLYLLSKADGTTDSHYIRFTTPKKTNLILGTSRSAQGLQPAIFSNILEKDFFNYSFTVDYSPFGPIYLNSIKKKLNTEIRNGIFIIAVDPWSICSKIKDPNDSTMFRENSYCLANTNFVNMNPNFEYLLKNMKGKYFKTIASDNKRTFLHNDGWLEISVPMDSLSVANRITEKMEVYWKRVLPINKFSSVRLNYLKKTVDYLKRYGKVYIVRLPVHPQMFELETELLPNFDEIIFPVAQQADGYLDMTNEKISYQYTDGNHLYKASGKLVSLKIAEWIKADNTNQIID